MFKRYEVYQVVWWCGYSHTSKVAEEFNTYNEALNYILKNDKCIHDLYIKKVFRRRDNQQG